MARLPAVYVAVRAQIASAPTACGYLSANTIATHSAEREDSDCRGWKVNFAQEHMQLVGIVLERAHRHTHSALAMATLVEREHGELLTQDACYRGKKRQIKSDWVQQYHAWPDAIDLVFERAHDALFSRVVPSVSQTCEVPR
jgi:hypothetical protein